MCPRLSANYVSCCPPNMAQVSVWAGNLHIIYPSNTRSWKNRTKLLRIYKRVDGGVGEKYNTTVTKFNNYVIFAIQDGRKR